jgi:E3 ubiquitin-protein ligase UBR4
MQSAPIQEQVIADGLKLITKFYSSCRQQDCTKLEEARTELGKLKCKQLLETIFESDREPILQASASRVLQAVFPKKEIYHQVIYLVSLGSLFFFYFVNVMLIILS